MLKYENFDNGRFYYFDVHKDLLNDLVLTIIRGGKKYSVIRNYALNDKALIDKMVNKLIKVRLSHGYKEIVCE